MKSIKLFPIEPLLKIFSFYRYIDSGVYHGITEEVLAPKLVEMLQIPAEKLLLWQVYTTSDFKLFRDDKQHNDPRKAGAGNHEWLHYSTNDTTFITNVPYSTRLVFQVLPKPTGAS